jgi:hypothetical protein
MTSFVAITRVQHGEEDGTVTHLDPGDSVDDLPNEVKAHLYVSGALAVAGSPDDPNTWVDTRDVFPTTPAVVEEALRQQAADQMFGVLRDGTHTQPGKERAADPASNLVSSGSGNREEGNPAGPALKNRTGEASKAASAPAQEA